MAPHARVRRLARLILAIDQGTTGTTCLVVDDELQVLGRGYRELPQSLPRPGWVEHDPEEIWLGVERAAEAALAAAGVRAADLDGDRDHEPARDDGALGARVRPCRSRLRSSGRTGAPQSAAASSTPS